MSLEDRLYRYLPKYSSLPSPVKMILASTYRLVPDKLKYGGAYTKFQALLRFEATASVDEVREYQLGELRSLVQHAVSTTAYYRDRFATVATEIQSFKDFHDLPLLSKKDVRGRSEDFVSSDYALENLNKVSTGGSTGEPLLLFKERGMARTKELAYMVDQWSRISYRPGDRVAMLRSALVRGRRNENLWEFEPVKNRWIYSAYDLTPGNMRRILSHMRQVKPRYLHVYPSALTQLASYMKASGEPPIESVKGILSGSENTYPSQLALFEDVFDCPVFRWYGLGEMAALAGSCENSHKYHAYNTYSYVELLDPDGKPVTRIGETGEVVGTAFHNFAMPLIRYRTGDYAVYGGNRCEQCGRQGLMLSEIEGRAQEYVIDKQGNKHSLAPFIFGIHDEMWSNISAIQFLQREAGQLELLATSGSLSDADVIEYMRGVFEKRFSPNFDLVVKPVNEIPRTQSGKQMYLDQRLEI